MSERRRDKRYPSQLRVWCEGEDLTLYAEATNVSRGGLFVRTSSPPPPDRALKISMEPLGAVADACVCWVKAGGAGARSGMGLEIRSFLQGQAAYDRFVEQSTSRSGEFALSLSGANHKGQTPPDDS